MQKPKIGLKERRRVLQGDGDFMIGASMARFLSGLNMEIANVIELQHYVKLELLLKMKSFTRINQIQGLSMRRRVNWRKDEQIVPKAKAKTPMAKEGSFAQSKNKFFA